VLGGLFRLRLLLGGCLLRGPLCLLLSGLLLGRGRLRGLRRRLGGLGLLRGLRPGRLSRAGGSTAVGSAVRARVRRRLTLGARRSVAALRRLEVGEEVVPGGVDRLWVGEETLVHFL